MKGRHIMNKQEMLKEKLLKEEMLKEKKLFLFDIDGTLAVGSTLYSDSAQLLQYIADIGGQAYFITNNSTKSNEDYVRKFQADFGLVTTPDQFITSGYMTLRFLMENYKSDKIYVMGTQSFIHELRGNGLQITEDVENDLACVVVAYDSELSYAKLTKVCQILEQQDIPFYGTNPDLRCPIDFGFIPDCGAICNMVTATTDKQPIYLGKPSEAVVQLALERSGFTKEETLVVGDRLYTDIACGINGDVDTCVLFTGEAKPSDLVDTVFQPTYSFQTVGDLLAALKQAQNVL